LNFDSTSQLTEPPKEGDRAVSWWCWGLDRTGWDHGTIGCAGT